MKVILGIGNPGGRYQFNRHNVGFLFLDFFAQKHSLSFVPSKYDFYTAEGIVGKSPFALIKPTTFVNNSGFAAKQALDYFNISSDDLLIVYDDINIDFGKFKVKASGSDGGHNGISSIIYHLSSNQFPRIKIGIGKNFDKGELVDYVLADFSEEEKSSLKNIFSDCMLLSNDFIFGGAKALMDSNSKLNKPDSNQNQLNQ